MGKDIQPLLDDWQYDPEKLCVRRIKGEDGHEKIQLRIEMGILQMDISGRPDGQRPHGSESLLSFYQQQALESKGSEDDDEGFLLDAEACMLLQMEALQYYHRRISFLELGEYKRAQEDAGRNLELFDFVKEYAADEEDRIVLEQYRPFVIGHRVRAAVLQNLEEENFDLALGEIEDGIEEIRGFFNEFDRPDLVDESEEITFLKEWAEEIRKDQPRSLLQDLKDQLREAVALEDFERAAELRDRLRAMPES
tara:strand:+ start:1744 stop:2499 length:756 start_codon:yes stop_codon:yes gene_type:complete